jgi:hypothetical protein
LAATEDDQIRGSFRNKKLSVIEEERLTSEASDFNHRKKTDYRPKKSKNA